MMTVREMIERVGARVATFERLKFEGKNGEAVRTVPTAVPMGAVVEPIEAWDGTVGVRLTSAIDGTLVMLPSQYLVQFDGAPVLWNAVEGRLK